MSRLWRGVTGQLLLLTVLPLALFVGVISFGSIAMHQQAMRDLVGQRDLRTVMATAHSLGTTLQRKLDTLRRLAAGVSASPDPATALGEALHTHEALQELPSGIALYTPDGALITTTAGAQAWATTDLISGWAQTAPDVPPLMVRGQDLLLAGQDHNQRVVAVSLLPVEALGVGDLVNPSGAGGALAASIFDSGGRVLYHTRPDLPLADMSAHAGVAEALRGEHGVLYQADATGGEEHVVSYAPIRTAGGATGLGILIEEPWAIVLDPMMQYSLAGPLVSLPVLVLALVAVAFGLRRIVQPLQKLDEQARKVGTGEYDALAEPVRGIEEIEQLHTTLRRMAAQIHDDQERLRGYARKVLEAQETERGRLARELHDDTIQNLIVLSQRVQSMRLAADRGTAPGAARLSELRADVLQMIEDVRRFSRALRPIYLEEAGLPAAIERLVSEVNESAHGAARSAMSDVGTGRAAEADMSPAKASVTFQSIGDIPRLKADVELALFRITQEALSNALRHASASRIAISLVGLPEDEMRLRIQDDGQGFAGTPSLGATPASTTPSGAMPTGAMPSGGFGLMGIRERADLIGATVSLTTTPGQGTRLDVTYPIPPRLP